MNVPESRGLTFYQVVTLASIVEHEAVVDDERALIAGVYQNRLDGLGGRAKILNADPTVTYATDTMALAKLPFEDWKTYFFWKVPPGQRSPTSRSTTPSRATRPTSAGGLIPGPISTPSLASIDAALAAGHEGPATCTSWRSRTPRPMPSPRRSREHNANLHKYGYL